jgi:hypothetical protein
MRRVKETGQPVNVFGARLRANPRAKTNQINLINKWYPTHDGKKKLEDM